MKTPKQLSVVVTALNYGIAYRGHTAHRWAGQDDERVTMMMHTLHAARTPLLASHIVCPHSSSTHTHTSNESEMSPEKSTKSKFPRAHCAQLFVFVQWHSCSCLPTRQEILSSKEQLVNASAMTKRKFPVFFSECTFCVRFLSLPLFLVPSTRPTSSTLFEKHFGKGRRNRNKGETTEN